MLELGQDICNLIGATATIYLVSEDRTSIVSKVKTDSPRSRTSSFPSTIRASRIAEQNRC